MGGSRGEGEARPLHHSGRLGEAHGPEAPGRAIAGHGRAFDDLNPNRREALWEAGLPARPSRSGQRAFPVSAEDGLPDLADFTAFERMAASTG